MDWGPDQPIFDAVGEELSRVMNPHIIPKWRLVIAYAALKISFFIAGKISRVLLNFSVWLAKDFVNWVTQGKL